MLPIGAPPPVQAGSTVPNPLNVMQLAAEFAPSTALTFTPVLPSLPSRDWISRGATLSELAALQAPAGLSKLTTHEVPVALRAQLALIPFTSQNDTRALRRSASERASCRPACMLSAVVRILVFWIKV